MWVLDKMVLTNLPYCLIASKDWLVASLDKTTFWKQLWTPTREDNWADLPPPMELFKSLLFTFAPAEVFNFNKPLILTEEGRRYLACAGTEMVIIGLPLRKL